MARRSRNNSRQDSGASGALLIDKPSGLTSHDVVDRIRKTLGTRKVGHAGTLDPDATGLLVLGVGPGTKLLQFVTGNILKKIYHTISIPDFVGENGGNLSPGWRRRHQQRKY